MLATAVMIMEPSMMEERKRRQSKTDTRSRSDFRAKWRSSILHKTK